MPRDFELAAPGPGGLVVAIFGPTASGKSAVAEALAERLPAEIISADSMQVYRGLPILTNQPRSPTHLVGIWPLDHEASVGEYQRLAHAAIDTALDQDTTPIISGGTGLYFRAALADLELPPPVPAEARTHWETEYDRLGADELHALLAEGDPEAAAAIHKNDRRRVVRALELVEIGRSLRPSDSRLWTEKTRHRTTIFGLELEPAELSERINTRTQQMFESGVEAEVAHALERSISSTARHIIGIQEIRDLPRAEAIDAISQRTRSLAAYQRKWMRRLPGLIPIKADTSPSLIAQEILEALRDTDAPPAEDHGSALR